MKYHHITSLLPYSKPFLFVEGLSFVDDNGVIGFCTFSKELDFYKGHFKRNPVTPGVILTECCAQIGLVCLGIHLLTGSGGLFENLKIGLSSSEMEFFLPVYPGEKVQVTSKKKYFRFHKLKCEVQMHNEMGKLICKGSIAGMIKMDANG